MAHIRQELGFRYIRRFGVLLGSLGFLGQMREVAGLFLELMA